MNAPSLCSERRGITLCEYARPHLFETIAAELSKSAVIIGQLPVGSGLANCSELVIHRVIHISRKLEPHTPVFIASM